MRISQNIFTALKFWIAQNLVEIIVVLILGYLGFDVMNEFCRKCLLIENIEGTAWGIGFKLLIFLLPYIILFIVISFVPYFKNNPSNIKNAQLNGIVSCLVIFLIEILKPNEFSEMLRSLLATFISSVLIILFFKIKDTR
jgi:hypothetical protein